MKSARRRPALKIVRLAHAQTLPLPQYQSQGAAGFDLAAAVPEDSPLSITPGERVIVPTGLVFELPAGFEAQVRPRSGLATKFGVTVLNSPGTIDADYRGEVAVILINLGHEEFVVRRGDRIAQVVIAEVARVTPEFAADVKPTKRGSGGFGSTGVGSSKPIARQKKGSGVPSTKPRTKASRKPR